MKNDFIESIRAKITSGARGVIPQQLLAAYDEQTAECQTLKSMAIMATANWENSHAERQALEKQREALENELRSARAGLLEAEATIAADNAIIQSLRQSMVQLVEALDGLALKSDL